MQANGVGAAGTAASVAAVAAAPPASDPAAGSVAAVHPAKLTRDVSPEISRGNLLDDSFPLETSESDRTKFVKDSLPKSSKEALVGWASDAKDAVAAEHQIGAASRGRSRNGLLF